MSSPGRWNPQAVQITMDHCMKGCYALAVPETHPDLGRQVMLCLRPDAASTLSQPLQTADFMYSAGYCCMRNSSACANKC